MSSSSKMSKAESGKLGWKAAKATHELNYRRRMEVYKATPTRCKFCEAPLPYTKRKNKFCGSSCAAKATNHMRALKKALNPQFCLSCGSFISQGKYCSNQCQQDYEWEILRARTILNPNQASSVNLKRVVVESRGKSCEECGRHTWQKQDIPLDLDHINGDPFDNRLQNLRLLCLNCHGLTPTFKGKNRGKGRTSKSKDL